MNITTAVILAAGLGTRLRAQHAGLPKGFVEVGGETLIARSLRLLRGRGIERVVLVTGHEAERYRELARRSPGVETAHNAHYASTGSMASLACALGVVDEDFLLLESDLYYEARALDVLLDARAPDGVLVSGETRAGDEVFVEAALGRLVNMSKQRQELASCCGELVGICRISRALGTALAAELERFEGQHGHARMAYETDALVAVARQRAIPVHLISDLLWGELDDAAHLERVREQLVPAMRERDRPRLRAARNLLFNPGPATTGESVKAALVMADECPREQDFCALYADVRHGLAALAGEPDELAVVPLVGSGTSSLEAMLTRLVGPGDRLLVLDNGDYGARLAHIARTHGLEHGVYEAGWARPLDLHELEQRLLNERPTHLALVHHETSSGLCNDVDAVTGLARRHGCLVLVDAMSSFGALPIRVGTGGVDALVASSNKCLEGIAGLGFTIATRALLERSRSFAARSVALDLVAEHAHLSATGQSRFTVPPQLVSALAEALRLHRAEGRAGRHARYAHNMRRLVSGLERLGFEFLLDPEQRGDILLAVREPQAPWYSFAGLHAALRERGLTIYPGKPSPERTFRLSVLGDLHARDIERLLAELEHHVRSAQE